MGQYAYGERVVKTSSDDRVVFPDDDITKGDVTAYYHRIAELMLPHVQGRPMTMQRFPKGLAKNGFYHKRVPTYFPKWIERADMKGGDDRVVYAVCDLPETLVYMANQNTIAFHVWTSRHATPNHPDQLVFDLDPPEGRFDLVRLTALALRELLTELGMTPFVKTSGSAGLHVVVSLDGKAAYPEVQAFAAAVAERICSAHPNMCTTEFYKKDRGGRLFVDLLRNARGATVVAAYSLRAKPTAPISAPLSWQEVQDAGLTATKFHLGNIEQRIATVGDLWSELFTHNHSITTAAAILAG